MSILNSINEGYPPVKSWEWVETSPTTATCTRQGGDGVTPVTYEVTHRNGRWWVKVSCPILPAVTGTGPTLAAAWENNEELCAEVDYDQ